MRTQPWLPNAGASLAKSHPHQILHLHNYSVGLFPGLWLGRKPLSNGEHGILSQQEPDSLNKFPNMEDFPFVIQCNQLSSVKLQSSECHLPAPPYSSLPRDPWFHQPHLTLRLQFWPTVISLAIPTGWGKTSVKRHDLAKSTCWNELAPRPELKNIYSWRLGRIPWRGMVKSEAVTTVNNQQQHK